ncbi:uncharacterized protein LTHEOB_12917, partial [Neofusicoccum parvum]
MGRKQAELIGNEVGGWHGLIMFPSELEVPAQVERPIAELPLFEDGLLCQKDPGNCRYICRDTKGDKMTMKKHWRVEHGWSVGGGSRGRLSRRTEEGLDKRLQEAYFEVCRPEPEPEQEQEAQQEDQAQQPAQEGGEQLWQRAWNKANQNWQELEKRARATIEEGEKDEVSPWLDRT